MGVLLRLLPYGANGTFTSVVTGDVFMGLLSMALAGAIEGVAAGVKSWRRNRDRVIG